MVKSAKEWAEEVNKRHKLLSQACKDHGILRYANEAKEAIGDVMLVGVNRVVMDFGTHSHSQGFDPNTIAHQVKQRIESYVRNVRLYFVDRKQLKKEIYRALNEVADDMR